jgi:hypothetical protein
VAALRLGQAESQRGAVCLCRVGRSADAAQQLGSRDVELRPAREARVCAERVEDDQAGGRPFGHRDRDRPVGLYDGGGFVPDQLAVKRGDLPPVGFARAGRARVAGGDRRVQLVRPRSPGTQRRLEQCFALGDLRLVPP